MKVWKRALKSARTMPVLTILRLFLLPILNYNDFPFAFFFSSNPTRTLPIGVALFQGERLVNLGQMIVASLIGVIPIYLVSVLFQRRLVSGLANASARYIL